jgi:hypothetical protein
MKLTDTQLILLGEASAREDRAIIMPECLKGGTASKVIARLLKDGLVQELAGDGTLPVWRHDEEKGPFSLVITFRGLRAINAREPGWDRFIDGFDRGNPPPASCEDETAPGQEKATTRKTSPKTSRGKVAAARLAQFRGQGVIGLQDRRRAITERQQFKPAADFPLVVFIKHPGLFLGFVEERANAFQQQVGAHDFTGQHQHREEVSL